MIKKNMNTNYTLIFWPKSTNLLEDVQSTSMGYEIDEIKNIDVWDEKIGALVYCDNDINRLKTKADFSYSVKDIENGSAKLVIFKEKLSINQLNEFKADIRNKLNTKLYLIKTKTRYSLFHLNVVHTPSSIKEMDYQQQIISNITNNR